MYHIIEIVESGKKPAVTVPDEWLALGSANNYFVPDLVGIQLG